MKHTKHLLCLILSAIISCGFCGCNEKKAGSDYASLSEIYAHADEVLEESFQNMEMPEQILLDQPQSLYTIPLDHTPIDKTNPAVLREFVKSMVSNYETGCEQIYEDEDNRYVFYESDQLYAEAFENGSELLMVRSGMQYYLNVGQLQKCWHLTRPEFDKQERCMLNGTEYTISSLLDSMDTAVKKSVLPFSANKEARAKTAGIYLLSDQTQQFVVEYEYMVNGLPIDNMAGGLGTTDESHCMVKMSFVAAMTNPDQLALLRTESGWPLKEPTKLEDRFLTLSAALRLTEDYLAPEHVYQVNDIEMRYVCITDPQTEQYTFRPCWHIIMDEQHGEHMMNVAVSVYIDMQDGRICIEDTINGSRTDFSQYDS